MNAWDKGLGSALTYAERYYLMKTFHIATDEDDVDALVKEEAIKPQTSQAVQARRAASGRSTQAETYEPVTEEAYWKIVEAYAQGKPTKTGGDYKQTWIEMTHAGQEQIQKFDHDVDNYRAAVNL